MARAEQECAAEITQLIAILHKWGIHTLGDFAALHPEEIGERLGPQAVRLWQQATGKSHRLLKLVRPPENFSEEMELDYEIETTEPLLFLLRRFLEQLSLRLDGLFLVAQEIKLRLNFSDQSHYEHRFQIPAPTSSVDVLFRLLQTHLENFRAIYPIIGVAIEAEPARPDRQQFQLFETPLRDPGRLHETLNRLTGLLGRERVGRPVLEDSHRPDAFHLEPFLWEAADSPTEPEAVPGPALRRLRGQPPAPISPGRVMARQGPYLASGNWWDEKQWEQREWDLELSDGTLCRCRETPVDGEIEGIYD